MGSKFKNKAMAPPPVAIKAVPAVPVAANREPGTLEEFTNQIRADLSVMESAMHAIRKQRERVIEARGRIIQSLITIRDNKKKFLVGRSFQSYIEDDLGMSRGHVYETMQAYELCLKYDRPELYIEGLVDTKILVNVARVSDEKRQAKLMKDPESLTRADFVRRSYKKILAPADLKPAVSELLGDLPAKEKAKIKRDLIRAIEQA